MVARPFVTSDINVVLDLMHCSAIRRNKECIAVLSDVTKYLAMKGCVHHLLTEAFMAEDMHQNQSSALISDVTKGLAHRMRSSSADRSFHG